MKILVINPGSTSTKIAVYENREVQFMKNIHHSVEELSVFSNAMEQYSFRKELIEKELESKHIPVAFDAVIGRGGLVKPIPGGVYLVNEQLRYDTLHATRAHACNLGGLIAYDIASKSPHCKAFIADPGIVDELAPEARYTGCPLITRKTTWHALNQKAIARKYAKEVGSKYEKLNLIICHLGGGISVAAHRKGKAIEANNALDGEGPFSPERAGTLPAGQLVDLCYSGKYTHGEMKKKLHGDAGLAAHLGLTNMITIEKQIANGDKKAARVVDAMVYTIAKSIGAAAVALYGKIDAILITGGIAYSDYVIPRLKERIDFLAQVLVYPGENEMDALAMNAYYALKGDQKIQEYK
jgi:butyrate kinase